MKISCNKDAVFASYIAEYCRKCTNGKNIFLKTSIETVMQKGIAMRKIVLTLLLSAMMLYTSGCAAIIGGIIGHQSGEAVAGAAIGAGLEFGPGIVRGIGQIMANPEKDIKNARIDSQQGQIILPEAAFTPKRLECLTRQLQDIFQANQWTGKLEEKKSRVGCTVFQEKWQCKTKDEVEFEMTVVRKKRGKPGISIEVPADDQNKRSEITIQIFEWLPEAAKRKK